MNSLDSSGIGMSPPARSSWSADNVLAGKSACLSQHTCKALQAIEKIYLTDNSEGGYLHQPQAVPKTPWWVWDSVACCRPAPGGRAPGARQQAQCQWLAVSRCPSACQCHRCPPPPGPLRRCDQHRPASCKQGWEVETHVSWSVLSRLAISKSPLLYVYPIYHLQSYLRDHLLCISHKCCN